MSMTITRHIENLTRQAGQRVGRSLPKSSVILALWLVFLMFSQTLLLPWTLAAPSVKKLAAPQSVAAAEAAAVRHAPVLNGRIDGSVRQLTGESVTFNSSGAVTGDLLVPGTPTVKLNGSPNYGGSINGTGSAQPTGYFVTLNSGATLGRLVKRTDPITLESVPAPPASQGTRSVVINSPNQSPGNFATLRDLTLNSGAGLIAVPPGTYRNFTANSGGFILGVAGSTQPAVYNMSILTLNSATQVQVVGPVVLTLASAVTLNSATVGSSANPAWMTLKVAGGGVTLNGGSSLYGVVRAPSGAVTLNAPLRGSVQCDRLTVNSSGSLTAVATAPGTLESISPGRAMQGQTLTVTLTGRNTHWVAGQTQATLGGEISIGGAAPGAPGNLTVANETTAVADLTVSATAALGPRTLRVVTPLASGGSEDVSLADSFIVTAVTPPGAASTNVTTLAGSDNVPGFADGPAAQARFRDLAGIAVGSDDAVYVADAGNNRIRVVRPQAGGGTVTWMVQTLAGDGTAAFRDGAGSQARFNNPQGVAIDAGGAVYVADTGNHRIRRIAPDGTVTTVAGDGTAGYRNGSGAQARFNAPRGLALDAQGNLYVADTGNSTVRFINGSGEVQTVAGDGTIGINDSPSAHFNGLAGVAVDETSVFIYLADSGNHRIRRLDTSGTVITLAGAERGFADGDASAARFAEPSGLAMDGSGRIVVADTINSLVRVVSPDLVISGSPSAVTTVAGTGERGLLNGAGNVARFNLPRSVAVSLSSAIIVADSGNHVLRRVGMPPLITSISPSRARVNTIINIYGEGFDGRAPELNSVKFARAASAGGGQTTAEVTAATRTQLSVIVPADAANGPVSVTTADGTAISPVSFEVAPNQTPAITDFNPRRGSAGTSVTLTGTALQADTGATSVTFASPDNTRLQALVTSSNATEVHVTVPNGAVTGRIELTNAWGQATTDADFVIEESQDFQVTAAPSSATAVQRGQATYMVYVSSQQASFTQLARLSTSGLPEGARATFRAAQVTAGDKATLSVSLANVNLSAGSYPFTIKATAEIDGHEIVRTVNATLNVIPSGETTLSGRVLSTEGEPIIGATASLDGQTATTDAAGAFLLSGVSEGYSRPLMVDGRTASAPNRSYPFIIEPADIIAGEANAVPYTFYLPVIDTQYEVNVVPGQNTVVTNPRVPGLTLSIPAGANLRNRDGSPVTRVSVTPVPIDRTPAPLPSNVTTGMVFTAQPGGALTDVPIPVVFPNTLGAPPGTPATLYAFNHDEVQWEVYGYGQVSSDGLTIVPDIDPNTGNPYGLSGFSWYFPAVPSGAGQGGNPGGGPGGGGGGGGGSGDCGGGSSRGPHPVDYSTGMKIEKATDIFLGGARGGLELSRTYTSDLGRTQTSGRFGLGTKDNFDFRLTGVFEVDGAGQMVTPEDQTGRLFSYTGQDIEGNIYFKSGNTIQFLGDVIKKNLDGTFEYRTSTGGFLRFDANGRLSSVADSNGNSVTLYYGGGSSPTQITDAVGRSITLGYDSANRIAAATDPLNRTWHYSYDDGGRLAYVTDALGHVTHYTYDSLNQLTSITDPRGNVVKDITYDNAGRVIKQRFNDGGREDYAYTLSGTIVTETVITDALGRKTTKRFNSNGYVLEALDELGQVTHFERDFKNQVTKTTGACSCTEETREYDERGNPTVITDRLGRSIRSDFDATFNHVTRVSNKLNQVTLLGYDSRGNLTTITDPLQQVTTNVYDGFGRLIETRDAAGSGTRYEYDAHSNISARIDKLGHRWTMAYDIVGRMTSATDPLNRRTEMTYDSMNRVETMTDESGAVTHFTYDLNGNRTKVRDQLNREWTTVYDALNRPVQMIDPLGRATRLRYDIEGELLSTTSPSGRVVKYTYDSRGRVETATDPLNAFVKFTYDSRGNLESVRDKRGYTTSYAYDELNRRTLTRNPLGQTINVVYDGMDRVTEITDELGHRATMTYDALHRMLSASYADAQVSYTYDALNRVKRVDDSQNGSVQWDYDAVGRVLSETSPAGTISYTYNDAGQRATMTAADRLPVNYSYDTAGRLEHITQGAEQFTYAYDQLSRLASLTRPNGVVSAYNYDQAGRLERLRHLSGASQAIEDYRFTYTINDEIASVTSLQSSQLLTTAKNASIADAANRLTQFGAASFAFDNKGQTTTRNVAQQGATQYRWDARGRMTDAILPDGQTVSYAYDALGRRKSRTQNNQTTAFLYDGQDVVLDRNADSSTIDYLNGPGIDNHLRQTSGATGALYFLRDHLGSTQGLTNSSGSVVEWQRYTAFGESTGSSLTRYGFTGREVDGATGLLYYRARWYDPQQGRFLSQDPMHGTAGLNLYSYAANNPLSLTDPLGLEPGPVNYLRNPFSSDHWILNGLSNTVSDVLQLDTIAEASYTLGDYRCSAGDRAWAAFRLVKAAGEDVLLAVGVGGGLSGLAERGGVEAAEVAATESEELVSLYHGSIDNASGIMESGLDVERAGATYTSTDLEAAQDAINYRMNNFPQEVTDPGIIRSDVPSSSLQQMLDSGDVVSRPYSGFHGSELNSVEYLLTSPAAKALFNSGILR